MSRRNLAAILLLVGTAVCHAEQTSHAPIAIDVLLEPDDVMETVARKTNADLFHAGGTGFSLDQNHRPHLTLVQRYILPQNLERIGEYGTATKRLWEWP